MHESQRYAVRHSQPLCSSCQELYHSLFFSFFLTASGFENDLIFWQFQSQQGKFDEFKSPDEGLLRETCKPQNINPILFSP